MNGMAIKVREPGEKRDGRKYRITWTATEVNRRLLAWGGPLIRWLFTPSRRTHCRGFHLVTAIVMVCGWEASFFLDTWTRIGGHRCLRCYTEYS